MSEHEALPSLQNQQLHLPHGPLDCSSKRNNRAWRHGERAAVISDIFKHNMSRQQVQSKYGVGRSTAFKLCKDAALVEAAQQKIRGGSELTVEHQQALGKYNADMNREYNVSSKHLLYLHQCRQIMPSLSYSEMAELLAHKHCLRDYDSARQRRHSHITASASAVSMAPTSF
jgi:hypothetical protein